MCKLSIPIFDQGQRTFCLCAPWPPPHLKVTLSLDACKPPINRPSCSLWTILYDLPVKLLDFTWWSSRQRWYLWWPDICRSCRIVTGSRTYLPCNICWKWPYGTVLMGWRASFYINVIMSWILMRRGVCVQSTYLGRMRQRRGDIDRLENQRQSVEGRGGRRRMVENLVVQRRLMFIFGQVTFLVAITGTVTLMSCFRSSHCNSFEDRAPVDFIYRSPNELQTLSHDRVPG